MVQAAVSLVVREQTLVPMENTTEDFLSRFLCVVPFASSATASTAAPRVEIFTELACIAYKEHYTIGEGNKTIDSIMNAAMMVAGGLSDGMLR